VTYDDDRVVALLKEAVPDEAPAVPGRVDAVRRLAGRQRAAARAQAFAGVASVTVLVVAVALALRPGTAAPVAPVREPVRVMARALLARETVHWEETRDDGVRTHGAFRVDGTRQFEEPLTGPGEPRRVVDGVTYRAPEADEELPAGKSWVRDTGPADPPFLVGLVRRLPSHVRSERVVRTTEVRGVPVVEYAVTFDASAVVDTDGGPDVPGRIFLDADGLPRRITLPLTFVTTTTSTFELFGYDEPVEVTAPPMRTVVAREDARRPFVRGVLEDCTEAAASRAAVEACARTYEQAAGGSPRCTVTWRSREEWAVRCTDGTAHSS
jgi:hypothetical protein